MHLLLILRRNILLHTLQNALAAIVRLRHLHLLLLLMCLVVCIVIMLLVWERCILLAEDVITSAMHVYLRLVQIVLHGWTRAQHLLNLLVSLVIETADLGATAGRVERFNRALVIRHRLFAAL